MQYVLLIFAFLLTSLTQAQCEGMAINLTTQADNGNFAINYPSCTTIGRLNIHGDIYNLNGLS